MTLNYRIYWNYPEFFETKDSDRAFSAKTQKLRMIARPLIHLVCRQRRGEYTQCALKFQPCLSKTNIPLEVGSIHQVNAFKNGDKVFASPSPAEVITMLKQSWRPRNETINEVMEPWDR